MDRYIDGLLGLNLPITIKKEDCMGTMIDPETGEEVTIVELIERQRESEKNENL